MRVTGPLGEVSRHDTARTHRGARQAIGTPGPMVRLSGVGRSGPLTRSGAAFVVAWCRVGVDILGGGRGR